MSTERGADGGRVKSLGEKYPHLAQNIADAVERVSPFSHHGLRVIDDRRETVVGTVLPPSRRWVEGAPTREVLNGTSVIGIDGGIERIRRGIARLSSYPGRYLLLVGSHRINDDGEDPGEKLLHDPRVLAVLDMGPRRRTTGRGKVPR